MTRAQPKLDLDHDPTTQDAHSRFAAILSIFQAHKASTDKANAAFNLTRSVSWMAIGP